MKFQLLISTIFVICLRESVASSTAANKNVTTSQDLKARQNSTATNNLAIEGRSQESFSEIQEPIRGSKRGGRMMDLDRLMGDISKDSKTSSERSLSGHRQSRILSEDLIPSTATSERNKAKRSGNKKKKMTIKGFIPIMSLEHAKEGKHLGDNSNDEEEEEESDSEQQPLAASNSVKEQLASGFGGQTSIGHASFGMQPQAQENNQWQQLQQPNNQALNYNNQQQEDNQQQEVGRANRKLLGSSGILSNLAAPSKRFVSNLVPQQNQIQNPMNIPLAALSQDFSDCMCVPFFQCKNGFLSEAQLSKSQLNQIIAANQQPQYSLMPQQQQFPRALNQQDLLQNHQSVRAQTLLPAQQNDQQSIVNDMIYEQLRKSIESSNLEQQLVQQQQQQGPFMSLDERSKAGIQQADNSSSSSETEERSLLNPLGRRNSNQQRCGIMRTCCRIPPHLLQPQQQNRFNQMHGARFIQPQARPLQQAAAYQLLQPAPSASYMNPVHQQLANNMEQPEFQQLAPSMTRPAVGGGNFMAGRCGTRQTLGISGRVQNTQPAPGSETTAEFGEFPAHVAILKKMSPGDSMFVCSAVLVSNQWLATAAHCVRKHRLEELKVRLGEWDVNRDDEFYPHVESNIREIIIHPDFQPASLINDLALLRLEQPMDAQQMPHIAPACLPGASEEPLGGGQRCWVAGWGKDAFGQQGTFQSVLKKVDLPIVGRQDCENALRYQTKLGRYFRLHQSAMCAGGERGKDACEGDGGAGLYCADSESGLTRVVGLVSWGVGCGQRGVPGVYTNLAALSGWIEQTIAGSGEENLYLDTRSNVVDSQNFKNIISERSNQNATAAVAQDSPATTTAPLIQAGDADLESRAG